MQKFKPSSSLFSSPEEHFRHCARASTTGGAEPSAIAKDPRPTAASRCTRGAITFVAVVFWALAITVGSLYGYWYETTPAETNTVGEQWPANTACVLCDDRPTLLMFVHPRCPCSRSSMGELALLMTHCHDLVDAQALFFTPPTVPQNWAKTDLWNSAACIPGVSPQLDLDGAEHRRFGARVSGEVFLFMPNGELVFHGGITAGRGHSGDNLGRSAIEAFLLHGQLPAKSTHVFGCDLETPPSLRPRRTALTDAESGP